VTATRLARAATIVALFGLLSRVLGFAREAVLAAVYGASGATDAFVNSLLLVNSVAAVLLYTLVTLVIPVFQQERAARGEGSAWGLLLALSGWTGLGLIALASVAALWPEAPAALFRLDPGRAAATAELVRVMAPALALQGVSALFTALLQIHGRFAGPAAVGVAFNLGIIVGVVAGQGAIGIEAAAWGVSAGALLQVLLQLPQFRRLMRRVEVRPSFLHPRLGAVGLMALPVAAASLLQQVNNFTDKLFASSLEAGRVTALSYANALGQAPRALLLLPLLTPLFPLISRMVAEGRERDAVRTFERATGLLGLVAVPMSLLLAVYAQEVTQLAFGRGRCGAYCVEQTGAPLTWYALGVWAGFLSLLCNRTLSAANRTREIMLTTILVVVLTIALDIALLGPMEQSGLALAATIGVWVNALTLLWCLRRRFGALSVRRLGRQQARLWACGGVAAGVALLADLAYRTHGGEALDIAAPLTVKVALALAAYGVAARLLCPVELAHGGASLKALTRRGARG
jgi:putative peptidoglycan lipid II flippase